MTFTTSLTRIVAPAIISAMLLPVAAHAAAPVTRQVVVNYSDLDLSRDADAKQMLKRIKKAALEACTIDERWDHRARDFKTCRRQAVAAAVANLGSPTVTAAYEGRSTRVALATR